MIDLLQLVASIGGVGALFGVIVFFLYRYDRKGSENRLREDRKFMEDRLTKILDADRETREANTKVLTELITYLKLRNGSHS